MIVQAIIFKKDLWNASSALKWLKKHKYKPIKRVHKTENFLRYRINEPNEKYNYITLSFKNGIEMIFMTKSKKKGCPCGGHSKKNCKC